MPWGTWPPSWGFPLQHLLGYSSQIVKDVIIEHLDIIEDWNREFIPALACERQSTPGLCTKKEERMNSLDSIATKV